jgi:Acyl-CoA thioesterase C-terminal domain/Acyl-CoA thioesterase N-terminal domain
MAVFEQRDGGFVATELARGPWDPNAQHGGAPAALLARAFERTEPDGELLLARITYEFVRPVPLGRLSVLAEIVRPGRRVQLLEGSITGPDGAELVRARALRVHRAVFEEAERAAAPAPAGPETGRENDYPGARPMFGTHAMEIRFVDGGFQSLGPATAWFRLRVPLVEGEQPSPIERLAAAADFGNGISSILPWDGRHLFINPDLTVYLERPPSAEWVCLEAQTRIASGGIGVCESVLYDERGRVGRATQALLVSRSRK